MLVAASFFMSPRIRWCVLYCGLWCRLVPPRCFPLCNYLAIYTSKTSTVPHMARPHSSEEAGQALWVSHQTQCASRSSLVSYSAPLSTRPAPWV
jgi:hypothetical protein